MPHIVSPNVRVPGDAPADELSVAEKALSLTHEQEEAELAAALAAHDAEALAAHDTEVLAWQRDANAERERCTEALAAKLDAVVQEQLAMTSGALAAYGSSAAAAAAATAVSVQQSMTRYAVDC